MLGFDRGGAYPKVFGTARRGALGPTGAPRWRSRRCCRDHHGQLRRPHPADRLGRGESPDRGLSEARQITLFEHGKIALNPDLRSRCLPGGDSVLAEVPLAGKTFLYASENYGTGKICDYLASIETNTKIVDNPARKAASAAIRDAEKTLASAERALAGLLADPAVTPAAKNAAIPALQKKITRARQAAAAATAARKDIPAKLPANAIDPGARKPRCCAPAAAACRWCCGCSRTTPSTGYRTSSTPTSATTTNTAPSPARPSSAAWPAPSPAPPPRSPSSSNSPALPASPASLPCSSTRSTPPRPPCPATTAPSPTRSPRSPAFNSKRTAFAGVSMKRPAPGGRP